MAELDIHLEKLRVLQAELLSILEAGYDDKAFRRLSIINNSIQVTEKRVKKTFIDRQVISPLKVEGTQR